MEQDPIELHSTTQSILLHLLPGILFGVKTKNIYLGILVHILCSMMNVVTGVAFLVRIT